MKISPVIIFGILGVLFVGANSVFTVDQREKEIGRASCRERV